MRTPPVRRLIVSRIKCGADLVAATLRFHVRNIRYAFNAPFIKIAEELISACQKHVVAATGSSPFKVRDNQRPERTMTGVRKPPPESSVPGDNLPRGSRRNQLRRGHGSPPVLSEVPHELSIPMRTPKSANGPRSNSFRPDSPSRLLSTGDGRLSHPPHHAGHGPFRTRPPHLS